MRIVQCRNCLGGTVLVDLGGIIFVGTALQWGDLSCHRTRKLGLVILNWGDIYFGKRELITEANLHFHSVINLVTIAPSIYT